MGPPPPTSDLPPRLGYRCEPNVNETRINTRVNGELLGKSPHVNPEDADTLVDHSDILTGLPRVHIHDKITRLSGKETGICTA